MSLTATLRAKFNARQTAAQDLGTPEFQATVEKILSFTDGTGANQADILWTDQRTIAASSSETLDLAGVLSDVFGVTVAAAELVALLVYADAGNTNDVVLGDATNPLALFGGTNPTFSVKPGGFLFIAAPGAAGQATIGAGSTDELKVANSGSGTGVTYQIAVLARSA